MTPEQIAELALIAKMHRPMTHAQCASVKAMLPSILADLERLAKLEAIVDRLPKTADGVAVVQDMKLYCDSGNLVMGYSIDECNAMPLSECYSTRESALAAGEEGK